MTIAILAISNVLLIISLIIICTLWRKYISSYLGEKGKNLATKEDIKAITEEVEAVKAQYTRSVEEFRNALARELELSKISRAELQIHKTEQFVKLIEYFNMLLSDKKVQEQIRTDEKKKRELGSNLTDLGVKLFFFASDNTVKKFVNWRVYLLKHREGNEDALLFIRMYAEFVVELRRDLGYTDTICDSDDLLNIILVDWWKHKADNIT
jgi:hypothetical protein